MSLESVLKRIHETAGAEEAKILNEAKIQTEGILKEASKEAEALYLEIVNRGKALAEREHQRLLVNARLEAKKGILKVKQELIGEIFLKLRASLDEKRFKKTQIFKDTHKEVPEDLDFYLNKLRPDCENEISKVLFK